MASKEPMKGESRLRLRVSAAAEAQIRKRHPWVFDESIREQNRPGVLGELAVVYDKRNRFLAIGLFDPESPLRVRILHRGAPTQIDEAFWRGRLRESVERRQQVAAIGNGYRLINGESDGWPGLVLDKYDSTLVLKLYTAAWFAHLEQMAKIIEEELRPLRLVLRLSRNIQPLAQAQFKRADGTVIRGAGLNEPVIFEESGLRFEADVLRGQKTGFFLDQRENRRQVAKLVSERKLRSVLNAFSFSGGFSLYAAAAGAQSVLDLDISAHALESARRNFALNQNSPTVAGCNHQTVQADAFEWLEKSKERFDLVVLDPPSMARRAADRDHALDAYSRLVSRAIPRVNRDGILLACSCSAQVKEGDFFAIVRKAALKSKRTFRELLTMDQPEDHPATFPEARYLKSIYVQL